ncbi:MAG: alpha/beta fold hydrolase, partial [Rhodobiaceae bacterium]
MAEFWPRAETSRFVQVDNIDFHVQVSGAGEDVLLLHGAGASAHSFSSLASRLTERYRVIAPDLPGQGFTNLLPVEAVGLLPFAEYLRELMSALDATP